MPYEGVPAALEEFDAVGLNRVFRWLCEAVFAICDGDAIFKTFTNFRDSHEIAYKIGLFSFPP